MKLKLLLLLSIFTTQINAQCWDKISSGAYHTIAIANDGTLWAWGYNANGQVGNNTLVDQSIPVQISTDTDWNFVGAGYYHSFAIKSNGTLWGWGYNGFGQLGTGLSSDSLVPVQIGSSTDWQSISGGEDFSVGIKTNGTLWTWGSDTREQLGNLSAGSSSTPTQVGTDNDWSQAAAGRWHVVALKTNNKVYTWGFNGNGQIGDGFYSNRNVPYLVNTIQTSDFIKVEAGVNSSLAIKSDNSLWICGTVGPTNTQYFQNFTYPTTWANVAAGADHVIGVKNDGTLWGWGSNFYGEISQPGYSFSNTPMQIAGDNFSLQVETNLFSSLVLKNDGILHVTGQNNGILGDGTLADKSVITAVSCPASLSSDAFEIQNSISLYPNPVKNTLNISFQDTAEIQKVVIYDVTGKQVKCQIENTILISVDDLKSGFYLLEATINDRKEVRKFIKQ